MQPSLLVVWNISLAYAKKIRSEVTITLIDEMTTGLTYSLIPAFMGKGKRSSQDFAGPNDYGEDCEHFQQPTGEPAEPCLACRRQIRLSNATRG